MMDIYNYHPLTGEYTGASLADESPLEEGVFLIPAYATHIAPPAEQGGYARVFSAGSWSQIIDRRGETWWAEDGTSVIVDFLGDPMDHGLTDVEPEPPEYEEPDPVIITAAQARLTKAGDSVELIGGGMGGIAGAFAIAPGLAYVQFAKDQGTSDYVVNAFGTGLYRCYVPIEEQYTDGFMLVTTDLAGAPEFPDCVTIIVTRI